MEQGKMAAEFCSVFTNRRAQRVTRFSPPLCGSCYDLLGALLFFVNVASIVAKLAIVSGAVCIMSVIYVISKLNLSIYNQRRKRYTSQPGISQANQCWRRLATFKFLRHGAAPDAEQRRTEIIRHPLDVEFLMDWCPPKIVAGAAG